MAKQIKKINIQTQLQVGAVQYWQRPSSRQMEMRGYSTGDDYTQYTATMPADNATAYIATETAKGDTVLSDKEEHTMVQITATTMAGGLMQVDTRLQSIYYTGGEEETEEEEEEEEEKTEEELEQEEEEDAEEKANAKTLSYDVSYQECPICTHPYLANYAKNDEDKANVMGMVAKGANIYRPIVYNDSGDRGTPRTILGAALCKIITCIPTFRVKITNITYGYSQHSNPEKQSDIGGGTLDNKPQVGDIISADDLPGKNKFGTPQSGGSAATDASSGTTIITFIGRNSTYEKGKWQVQDRYLIEEIPSLDSVKDRAAQAAKNS